MASYDDDERQPMPAVDDATLDSDYADAERKFNQLTKDLRLPFLEVKLYRKYFIQGRSRERLQLLREVNEVMTENRLQTLRLLKLIQEREAIVDTVFDMCRDFTSSKIPTLEVQTQVLQLLFMHQQVTLKVVEGIVAWRELLTHPFSFQWKGVNYVNKILRDCEEIDACPLKKVLPLRVSQFPLCSNITSINLFAEQAAKQQEKQQGGGRGKGRPTANLANAKSMNVQGTPPEMTKRLRQAESLIADEQSLQEELLRNLRGISNTGSFVPLLNLQHLIPNCVSGIHVSKKEWDDQNRQAMESALQRATDESTSASPSRRQDGSASDSDDDASSRSSSRRSSRRSSPASTPRGTPAKANKSPIASTRSSRTPSARSSRSPSPTPDTTPR